MTRDVARFGPITATPPGAWWSDPARACAPPRADPELFFPAAHDTMRVRAARAVCGRCVVRQDCLDYALDQGPDLQGIWGGTTSHERKNRRRRP
jgi:WhiB family redox-sensing transcriptional regulator